MRIRKNQNKLSDTERKAFVDAVKTLKYNPPPGVHKYDDFISLHKTVFEAQFSAGHNGPGFLPWHREFLLRFELALQAINPCVSVPYWDWTVDNSKDSKLWKSDFMGGNGSGPNNRVMTEPFAYNALTAISWKDGFVTATTITAHGVQVGQSFQIGGVAPSSYNGTFQALTGTTGNTLVYALATNPGTTTSLGGTGWFLNILPTGEADPFLKRGLWSDPLQITPQDVTDVLSVTPYDQAPWNNNGPENGFRPKLELGIHTLAHGWVGGLNGSMSRSCSPNDPVFWLHHCNIDRLWARWQTLNQPGWPYLPPSGSGAWLGHGLDDPMMPPWDGVSPTPRCVLDHRALGYLYDDEQATQQEYAAISWQMGSHWRLYAIGSDGIVYERRYDDPKLGDWINIGSGAAQGAIAAIIWPGSGDPANSIRIYIANRQADGSYAIQEGRWDGATWTNGKVWSSPAEVTSLAAVSWQDTKKVVHARVYVGYYGEHNIPAIRLFCWDDGQDWTENNKIIGRALVSAFSWEDGKGGVNLRVHVDNLSSNRPISVLVSTDGNTYREQQLP
jgi:hypothetical protein